MMYKYKNGNCNIFINPEDGTRIIHTDDDYIDLQFPLNVDVSIGRRCDGGCKFCYEGATPDGPEANLEDVPFLDSLRPYTEASINGNSVDHPQLIPFLEKLKEKKIIANMTVNQIHFERKEALIADLLNTGLVHGFGVSLRNPTPEFIERAQKYPTLVVHTIAGVHSKADYEALKDKGLKVLILGYKDKGRGHTYLADEKATIDANRDYLKREIKTILENNWYPVVAFDNLALEQLDIKHVISEKAWEQFYQGDEGTASMFIDLTDRTFGVSSLMPREEMLPITNSIDEMFATVKKIVA